MEAAVQEGGGGGAQSSAGRTALLGWINAARYVAGLAVMVLILVMVAYAIKVVVREKQLIFTVAGSEVTTMLEDYNNNTVIKFVVSIRAFNPSGRSAVHYTNTVQAFLLVSIDDNKVKITFPLNDMAVGPNAAVATDAVAVVAANNASLPQGLEWYTFLNRTTDIISDAVLQLNGTLTSDTYFGHNPNNGRPVTYTCTPITVRDRYYDYYDYGYGYNYDYDYGPPCETASHI